MELCLNYCGMVSYLENQPEELYDISKMMDPFVAKTILLTSHLR